MSNKWMMFMGAGMLAVVFVVILVAALLAASSTSSPLTLQQATERGEEAMMEETDETDDSAMMNEDEMAETEVHGMFVDYDPALLADANDGNVVLFFWAGWCPTCRALEQSLNTELENFPADLTILRTNYDTEAALKQKYGITYQHTLVQVDAEGSMLKKWSGSYTLQDILDQLI
ncbi:thioredoxin family protein [Candidatus Dojkabacteria bacterium]|uniref:Thioredoxin family protein n=1 Tax=Candidatus Dojkabacteria bacterium TaxID=2099670 RepID=A0A955I754_9BACT|nr:thioredoxin family protein [Candidatus Dojkabacteria bacterium]